MNLNAGSCSYRRSRTASRNGLRLILAMVVLVLAVPSQAVEAQDTRGHATFNFNATLWSPAMRNQRVTLPRGTILYPRGMGAPLYQPFVLCKKVTLDFDAEGYSNEHVTGVCIAAKLKALNERPEDFVWSITPLTVPKIARFGCDSSPDPPNPPTGDFILLESCKAGGGQTYDDCVEKLDDATGKKFGKTVTETKDDGICIVETDIEPSGTWYFLKCRR